MTFEPNMTTTQALQHQAWKEARARLRAPETLLKPKLVVSNPLVPDVPSEDDARRELMDFTIAAVANVAGLIPTDVLEGIPTVEICNARNLSIALCAVRHRLSERHIADYFGVHLKAVTNAAQELNLVRIDLVISSRTPLELALPTIWPRWIATLRVTTIANIQAAVSERWAIPRIELTGHRRSLDVVIPRQAAMALSKVLTKHSYPEIGRRFGNRDHTTVLHSMRKFQKLMADVRKRVPENAPVMQWVNAVYDELQDSPFVRGQKREAKGKFA